MLGGRLYARWLAGLVVLASGTLPFWGVVVETDTLEPLAWLTIAICVIRAEKDEEPRWWLAAGAIGGVASLAKYTVALYLVSIALGLLATPQRRLLARWQPWAGVLVAIVIAAPNLPGRRRTAGPSSPTSPYWRRKKTFRSRPSRFSCRRSWRSASLRPGLASGPRGLRLLPALCAVPVGRRELGLPHRRGGDRSRQAVLSRACLPPLIAGGAIALEAWLPRLAKPAFIAFVLAAGAVTAPYVMPLLPVESFIALQQSISRPSTGERLKLGVLPVYYADMFGWPELAEVVGKAYQALPPEDRERAVFFGRNYGEAAAVDFFGPPWGLPPAISGHENYFLWGPRGHDGSVMLILGGSRDDLLKDFRSVEPVGRLDNPLGLPEESGQTLLALPRSF